MHANHATCVCVLRGAREYICFMCVCCMYGLYAWYGRMYGYTLVVFMLQKNSVGCALFFYSSHMVVQVLIYYTRKELLLVSFVHVISTCVILQVVCKLFILKIFCRCFFNKSMFFFSLCCYVF